MCKLIFTENPVYSGYTIVILKLAKHFREKQIVLGNCLKTLEALSLEALNHP